MPLTSVANILSLLDERAPEVLGFALKILNENSDIFWAEISEEIVKIEMLYKHRHLLYSKLAASLASKIHYHLSAFKKSLYYALCAEELLVVEGDNEYVDKINTTCIGEYISVKKGETFQLLPNDEESDINFDRFEQKINLLFENYLERQKNKFVLEISLECKRIDIFERSIQTAHNREKMLRYAFRIVTQIVENRSFRLQLLQKLVDLYMISPNPDYFKIYQCLIFLNDSDETADMLVKLIIESEDSAVMAYQLAFDACKDATQKFLQRVRSAMQDSMVYLNLFCDSQSENDLNESVSDTSSEEFEETVSDKCSEDKEMRTSHTSSEEFEETVSDKCSQDKEMSTSHLTDKEKSIKIRFKRLHSILNGNKFIELHSQFLVQNNNTDLKILHKIKTNALWSVTHNSTMIANGLIHFGTKSHQFLRESLNWTRRAVGWTRFTGISTLGLIHRGNEKEAFRLLSPHLSTKNRPFSGKMYIEGGALFALGLIHANHGGVEMIDYFLNNLRIATTESVRHGGCLGLGLAAMGTEKCNIYEQIKSNLDLNDAVTGEAAAIGMGLVMLGSGSKEVINDMLNYAKDTSHEKIIRGLALGIAMTMYGKQEEADSIIDQLIGENISILRWAGIATIAMAYYGTSDNKAIRKLLHAAANDTSDDVRRWAATGIGFILFNNPESVVSCVTLLSSSYNAHVRYGAAMAIGIGCSGTALKQAIAVVEPLLDDTNPIVKQGALIAMAMLLIRQTKLSCPKLENFHQNIFKIIEDKKEHIMAKFGAILAMGILKAGGGNVTICLQTHTGYPNMMAAVGLLVFQNYWFWYPLANFISLAFNVTCIIVLNKDLKMPNFEFKLNSFMCPEPIESEEEQKKDIIRLIELSVTNKQKKKKEEKHKNSKSVPMVVDGPKIMSEKTKIVASNFTILKNPARVIPTQLRMIELAKTSEESQSSIYVPIKEIGRGGILMVRDSQPYKNSDIAEVIKLAPLQNEGENEDAKVEPDVPLFFLLDESESVDFDVNDTSGMRNENVE